MLRKLPVAGFQSGRGGSRDPPELESLSYGDCQSFSRESCSLGSNIHLEILPGLAEYLLPFLLVLVL